MRSTYAPEEPSSCPECPPRPDLTSLLEAGRVEEAREAARFKLPGMDFPAHAGLLRVRPNGSSLFFILQDCDPTSPLCPAGDDELTLWLQGGPGGPSQFGCFVENGPYAVTEDLKLTPRATSWTRRFSMVWIDQPVGTGFSLVGEGDDYCHDDVCAARDVYSALSQLAALFPRFKKLRVTGESYAGKWVPAVASYVLEQQKASPSSLGGMKLAGFAIGDGWSDPLVQLAQYEPLLKGTGILDEHGLAAFGTLMSQAIANVTAGNTTAAFLCWDVAINGDLTAGPPLLERLTGLKDYFNYDRTSQPASFNYWTEYVVQPEVRKALNVGNATLHPGIEVEKNLVADFMRPVVNNITYLLDSGVPGLIYVGQLDIIVGTALVDAYLLELDWSGKQAYAEATRTIWRIPSEPEEVAGWLRAAGTLTHAVVRNAGHIAPYDAPQQMLDLIVGWADSSAPSE